MRAHRDDFIRRVQSSEGHELEDFWLRKTKKPVLSVLMVRKAGGEVNFFNGINMEVCIHASVV